MGTLLLGTVGGHVWWQVGAGCLWPCLRVSVLPTEKSCELARPSRFTFPSTWLFQPAKSLNPQESTRVKNE